MNASLETKYDTNREGGEGEEKDGWVHMHLRDSKMHNPLRMRHPTARITTHYELKPRTSRWLDYILMTKEAAINRATRAGVFRGHLDVVSDHSAVVADIGVDIAGMAQTVVPMWTPHSVRRLKRKPLVTVEETKQFTDQVEEVLATDWGESTCEKFEAMKRSIEKAAAGTTSVRQTMHYPRRVKQCKHMTTEAWRMHSWCKRLRGARGAMQDEEDGMMGEKALEKRLRKATWQWAPAFKDQDACEDLFRIWKEGEKEQVRDTIRKQLREATARVKKEQEKVKQKSIRMALKRRNEAFEMQDGKGKRRFLASVFREVWKREELLWARNKETGEIASSIDEVGAAVRQVLETWMRSQITVEKRWGSWAAMMDMDTSGVSGDDGIRDEEMAEFATKGMLRRRT